MSVTIKAYLKLGNNANDEIRRFVVDQDVCSNFEYMTKKLMQVFPSLTTESFEVAWKDAEGDLVTFSSDEELVEALGQLSEDVFRIYIQSHASGISQEGRFRRIPPQNFTEKGRLVTTPSDSLLQDLLM